MVSRKEATLIRLVASARRLQAPPHHAPESVHSITALHNSRSAAPSLACTSSISALVARWRTVYAGLGVSMGVQTRLGPLELHGECSHVWWCLRYDDVKRKHLWMQNAYCRSKDKVCTPTVRLRNSGGASR
jgi:hypothetical protein